MSSKESPKVAMLDTSFLIRLLKEDEPLHDEARKYFQFFMEEHYVLYVSSVAIAEYCVRGNLDELPFENIRVVPFNLDHAERAGSYARTLFCAKTNRLYASDQRMVIPNDTKIFAQASLIGALFFVTADTKSSKAIDLLAKEHGFAVEHVDIHNPLSTFSGNLF